MSGGGRWPGTRSSVAGTGPSGRGGRRCGACWSPRSRAWTPIRIEETVENDQLVVKAELPGIDPDKDVEISVQERTLHIRAERRQETKEETPGRRHSEFRYGSFARRIPLPKGASEEQVTASYQDGILEVRVPLPPEKPAETAKRIQVRRT